MRTIVLLLLLFPAALSAQSPDRVSATDPRLSTAIDSFRLNLAALAPRRDSFAVRVQGNEIGWQRTVLERTADGYRYTDELQLPGIEQTTVLQISARGEMRSVEQRGTARGKETWIDVRYDDGRAEGHARTPSAPDSVSINEAVPTNVLDDNAVQALLPAFPWAPDARWSIPVFASGKGQLQELELLVLGTETVTVPAGTFDAYRAELRGGAIPVTFWVSTAVPHEIIKVGGPAMPLEFVRIPHFNGERP